MIDLSALGFPPVQTSHQGSKHDKADTSPEQGKDAKSFGDLVDQAGKRSGGKHGDGGFATLKDFEGDELGSDGKQRSDATATLKAGTRNAEDIIAAQKLNSTSSLLGGTSLKGSKNTAPKHDGANDAATAKTGDRSATKAGKDEADDNTLKIGKSGSAADAAALLKVGESRAKNNDTNSKIGDLDATAHEDDSMIDVDLLAADSGDAETSEAGGSAGLSSGAQKSTKSGTLAGVARRAVDGRAEVKTNGLKNNSEQKLDKNDALSIKDKSTASPSEELHALLGMTPTKDDADTDVTGKPAEKSSKTSGHAADDDMVVDAKSAKAEHADDAAAAAGKTDVPAAQAAALLHADLKPSDNNSAQADGGDDKASADGDINKLRLVSNDGKGRSVDIEIAKSTSRDHADTAAGRTDFVTVLDSRRYLGFTADGGNAATLTNAIKAEPSWAQVINGANAGGSHTATEVNTLKLQMNPEHLGNMTASLRLKGEELSVELRVENVEAYHQLSKDQDSIIKALRDQGFSIDQVSIQLSPSARSDAGQGSGSQNSGNQNQSGSGGQSLQQGGQGDNARQRDESARRNPNQNNWMGNDPTSTFSDAGTASSNARSGNLYL